MIDFDIYYNEIVIGRLNGNLVKKQNLTDEQVRGLKNCYVEKYLLLKEAREIAKNPEKISELRNLFEKARILEFEIQSLWNFERDEKFHRFWEFPGCTCPRFDNMDAWPTGFYVHNLSCPIHGTREPEEASVNEG